MLRYSLTALFICNAMALQIQTANYQNDRFLIGAKGFSKDKIGKITHEKLLVCNPEINGVYQYTQDGLIFYPKNINKGINYQCKSNESTINLYAGDFGVHSVFSLTKNDFLIRFNDKVSKKSFLENIEIYDSKNLAKHDKKFNIIDNTDDRFHIRIDDVTPQTTILIKDSITSVANAKINGDYEIFQENSTNFIDNPKAKTLILDQISPVSLDGGRLGVRIYLKEWINGDGLKKFIQIDGINDFSLSETDYSDDEAKNKLGYYYFIDITSKEFKPQASYKVNIFKGFGDNDNLLREDSSFEIKLGDIKPFLKFSDNGVYLSSIGDLGIISANTGTVKVVVEKLQEQNFRYFLNYDNENLQRFSKEVASKNYEIGGILNEVVNSRLKLDFAGSGDGIYKITAYYDDDNSISKVVYLSDIGISAKISTDEIFVHALRLSNNAIVANADVKVYSSKNELVANGITNDLGIFKFDKSSIGKDVASVVVSIGNERNFIKLDSQTALNPQDNTISQNKIDNYNAYVHFASNIIRPDDKLLGQIIIKNGLLKPLVNMPVKLKIKDPQNKTIIEKSINTNEFGTINFNEEISSDLTGAFNFELIFANKKIADLNFFIESFTPQRLNNEISLKQDKYKLGDILEAKLSSSYIFGGVASNLDADAELSIFEKEFKSDNFKDYSFANKNQMSNEIWQQNLPIKLNEKGRSDVAFALNIKSSQISSMLEGVLNLSVNDDGKMVSKSKNFDIYPFDIMSGIRADKTNIETNNEVNFNLVSVDPINDKEIKNRQKSILIKRKIWSYNIDQNGVLRWNEEYENIASFIQNTDNFTYNFTQSGNYKVIATDTLSTHQSSVYINVRGWDDSSIAPTKELSEASITTDKTSYKKGDEMSVNISSILKDGIALITLENNGVKKFQIANIKNNVANVKFKLDFDFDGLYVGASIVRVSDIGILPFRTYEKIYVNADFSNKFIPTSIEAPKFAKSNQTFDVFVKTSPNSEISLFAVDQGILNITDQSLGNPLEFFYSFKPQAMLDYDIYSQLLNFKKDGKILSFGGDGAMLRSRIQKFSSPIDKKNIKTFITMQTTKSDENGIAKFSIAVPQNFNSRINLATISLNEDKIGFDIENVDVKDDIIIKPSESAYFINGDLITYPLRLINTTNQDKNLTLDLQSNIKITLNDKKITLKANENVKVDLNLDANQTGKAFLKFIVKDSNQTYTNTQNFDIIPSYPLSTFVKSLLTSQKQTISLDSEFKNIKIDASNSIQSLLATNSDKLINYPYGCVEQRSSKLLELNSLMFDDENLTKSIIKKADIKRFIDNGIKDVAKMQKPDGEFGYWSELGFSNNFASIYTTFALLELEKNGATLPNGLKSKALKALVNFNSNNDTQALFAAYILSTQKRLDKSTLNALYDQKRYLYTHLDTYLMAATLKNEGLIQESKEAIKRLKEKDYILAENFGSQIRNKAFMLLLHARHFEKNDFSDELAKYLIKQINNLSSTQERAFTLMALREYLKNTSSNNDFKLIVDGKELTFNGRSVIEITPKSNEIIIEPNDQNIYVSISSSAYKPLAINHDFNKTGLDIIRNFVDKNGNEIDINKLKLNDVIYSKISLKTDENIEYGVINETISSCFEVINENFMPILRTNEVKGNLNLQHQNIQDDRVVSFYTLNSEEIKNIFTPLRVVRNGKCKLPAVISENMYDESLNDYDLAVKEFIVR